MNFVVVIGRIVANVFARMLNVHKNLLHTGASTAAFHATHIRKGTSQLPPHNFICTLTFCVSSFWLTMTCTWILSLVFASGHGTASFSVSALAARSVFGQRPCFTTHLSSERSQPLTNWSDFLLMTCDPLMMPEINSPLHSN